MVETVGVVGGGSCGLILSRMLALQGVRVTLVERLPLPGGQEPELPETLALAGEAVDSGVELMLGTTGLRWDGGRLDTLGVEGARRLELDALVVATGSRPATRGELGIVGDRAAGVLPGSAALHMIEAGMLPGHWPAVLGGGSLAGTLVEALHHAGAREVTVVAPEGTLDERARGCDRLLEGWEVGAAIGRPRLQRVKLGRVWVEDQHRPSDDHWIFADALLLAHQRFPMRNVDGAIEPAPGVVFCQSSGEPKTMAEARARAEQAISELRAGKGRSKSEV